jgi:hypothetical protein
LIPSCGLRYALRSPVRRALDADRCIPSDVRRDRLDYGVQDRTPDEQLAFWAQRLGDKALLVYVIQAHDGGPVKVGMANDVLARMRTLQTGNPSKLEVRAVMPGSRKLEWNFHHRFRDHRAYGEWFKGEAIEAIIELAGSMAERMIEWALTNEGRPEPRDFFPVWHERAPRRGHQPLAIRYVDPTTLPREKSRHQRIEEQSVGWKLKVALDRARFNDPNYIVPQEGASR